MVAKRKRLAERRRVLGYSQESLAERLGVDRSTVVRWERGETRPQPYVRPRLADVLRISPDELDDLFEDPRQAAEETWDRERLMWAIEDPRRADLEVVRCLEQAMNVITNAARTTPPAELIAGAAPTYALLRRFRREASGRARPPLLGLVSRCEQFIGRMYYQGGDNRQALSWSDLALASAHQAGDEQLVAYTLMRRSSLVGERGDHAQVVDLAKAARELAPDLPPHLVALSLRHEAQGYALAGAVSECLGTLEASTEFRERGDGADGPAYARGFTMGFHRVEVAACHLQLGWRDDAVEVLQAELPAWPASREKAYHLALLARAYAAEGYRDLADQAVREAVPLARRTGAARALRVLGGVRT